jgi:predicted regulator of Ras-like GTPase activity (Roadblock/LC7/MglB family)
MARIAVDRREFDRAIIEWETVLRVSPDHLGAMKGLGYVAFQQRRLEEAERYLSSAAAQGAGEDVSAALDTVRRSSVEVNTVESPMPTEAQWLFADLLHEDQQTALLLDASGYVLGGIYLDPNGNDLAHEIGAQLSGISDEVVRAMRHLDIGDWRSIVFETEAAVVAMAPAPQESLLVVAASRATPLGLMRRLLERCAVRAATWLQSVSER